MEGVEEKLQFSRQKSCFTHYLYICGSNYFSQIKRKDTSIDIDCCNSPVAWPLLNENYDSEKAHVKNSSAQQRFEVEATAPGTSDTRMVDNSDVSLCITWDRVLCSCKHPSINMPTRTHYRSISSYN